MGSALLVEGLLFHFTSFPPLLLLPVQYVFPGQILYCMNHSCLFIGAISARLFLEICPLLCVSRGMSWHVTCIWDFPVRFLLLYYTKAFSEAWWHRVCELVVLPALATASDGAASRGGVGTSTLRLVLRLCQRRHFSVALPAWAVPPLLPEC